MSQKHAERDTLPHRSPASTTPANQLKPGKEEVISSSPLRPILAPLNAKNVLYLQRTIGNKAVNTLIKSIHPAPEIVQRVAYDRDDGSCIFSDVQEGNHQITMTGSLRRDLQNVDNIVAKLDYHETTVPLSKVDDKAWFGSSRSADVIEITVVDAAPRGKRIGYVLAYHLGLVAQQADIKYIIAKNVTDARDPFYTPLGFIDAKDEPQWANLVNEKTQIETTIRTNHHVPNLPELLKRKQEITELMEKNTIFISTDDMIANAQSKMNGHWRRGR